MHPGCNQKCWEETQGIQKRDSPATPGASLGAEGCDPLQGSGSRGDADLLSSCGQCCRPGAERTREHWLCCQRFHDRFKNKEGAASQAPFLNAKVRILCNLSKQALTRVGTLRRHGMDPAALHTVTTTGWPSERPSSGLETGDAGSALDTPPRSPDPVGQEGERGPAGLQVQRGVRGCTSSQASGQGWEAWSPLGLRVLPAPQGRGGQQGAGRVPEGWVRTGQGELGGSSGRNPPAAARPTEGWAQTALTHGRGVQPAQPRAPVPAPHARTCPAESRGAAARVHPVPLHPLQQPHGRHGHLVVLFAKLQQVGKAWDVQAGVCRRHAPQRGPGETCPSAPQLGRPSPTRLLHKLPGAPFP